MTSIAPWMSVPDATAAVAYYKVAFGAVESDVLIDDAGKVAVAHLSVDGAGFWVQQDDGAALTPAGGGLVRMILSVDDPDAVFAQAVAAGATVVAEVYEGHGWRIGRIADPCGYHWEIGRPL